MYQKTVLFAIVACLSIWRCDASSSKGNLNDFLFDGRFDFIDLSHPFDNKTIYWPTLINFTSINQIAEYQPDGSWYAQSDMCAGEHGGTHIDAPYHFAQNGLFAGDISLTKLIVPLVVIDVTKKVNNNPDYVLYKKDLDLKSLNKIFKNKKQSFVVIFKFGWTKYYHDRIKYLGLDFEHDTKSFPGLSVEVAEWIVAQKNIVGVGVDVASADPGSSLTFEAHKVLLPSGLFVLEHVRILEDLDLPLSSCTALLLPMKIARGTGAPLRFVAICPRKDLC